MTNLQPAGFFLRLLAHCNNSSLFFLPASLILFFISKNNTLSSIWLGVVILLVVYVFLILPHMATEVIFTHLFGGNLGKLLTGLRVKSQSGEKLTLSRILFRQLIGYIFSSLLLGLGFLAVLKDPKKQAWHDKTVDSNVFKVQSLLPLGLISLVVLLGLHVYLLKTSFDNFTGNPVIKEEITNLAIMYSQQKQTEAVIPAPKVKK